MSDDFKMVLWLCVIFFVLPLAGLGVSEWRQQDCAVELAKVGRPAADIKEICK
jgi:hypothetical protein